MGQLETPQILSPVLIAAGCPHATVTRYRCLHLQEQLAVNGISAAVEEWYDPSQIDARRVRRGLKVTDRDPDGIKRRFFA